MMYDGSVQAKDSSRIYDGFFGFLHGYILSIFKSKANLYINLSVSRMYVLPKNFVLDFKFILLCHNMVRNIGYLYYYETYRLAGLCMEYSWLCMDQVVPEYFWIIHVDIHTYMIKYTYKYLWIYRYLDRQESLNVYRQIFKFNIEFLNEQAFCVNMS